MLPGLAGIAGLIATAAAGGGAMPAVRSVGTTGNVNALGPTANPGVPAGTTTNDIMLWALETDSGDSLTPPAGWAQVTNSPQAAASGTKLHLWWKRAGASETSPSVARVGDHIASQMISISGCVTSGDPWDVTAGDTGTSSTTQTIPGLTTTVANCLVLDFCSIGTDSGTAQFSGWANSDLSGVAEQFDDSYSGSGGGGVGCSAGGKAAAGAVGTTSVTLLNAATAGRIKVALKP